MIVGDDVSIRGNDHAAAQTMLNPVLRLLPEIKVTAKLITLATERTVRPKELLHVRHTFHAALLLVSLRHDRDIDHCRRNSRR
jgi:hypothetical protein